jgi:hypothetical protein
MFLAAFTMTNAAKATTIFNFDSDNLGTTTSFTDTVNGLSATFSSAADPGGFVIYSSMFVTLTGNVLGDPGPAGIDGLALDIAFNSDLNAIDLSFATADFGTPSPVTLTAYENSTLVGANTLSGMFIGSSLFPEGEIAFDGATFNNVVISSSAMDFAVDNIAVSSVPEPGPFTLVAGGIALLAIGSLRRTPALGRR